MNKLTLFINGEQEADDKKTAAFPRRRPRRLGRRRGGAFIEFYDLAQVSGDGVTFTDHPLLKVPTYSTSFSPNSGDPGADDGVLLYTMQQFQTADYQAYTDMMFNVPLDEWHVRYKRLGYTAALPGYLGPSLSVRLNTPHPGFFSLANKSGYQANIFKAGESSPGPTSQLIASDALLHADPLARSIEMLSDTGFSWWSNYPTKAPTRGLTYLESEGNFSAETGVGKGSWFPFSTTDKVNYKVTLTNDPNAADAGVIAPSGLTRIFLMPQITLWAASSTNANLEDKYILGPVYQVTPRRFWPRYTQTDWEHTMGIFSISGFNFDGVIDDPNDRKADFLEYQAARGGMQAASWTRTSGAVPFIDSVFNGSMSPISFPYSDNYISQGMTTSSDSAVFDSAPGGGAGIGGVNPNRGDLSFDTPGSFFDMTDPFLCAVIQKGSTFYYVWMLDPASDTSNANGSKYRLSLKYDTTFADLLLDDLAGGTPV